MEHDGFPDNSAHRPARGEGGREGREGGRVGAAVGAKSCTQVHCFLQCKCVLTTQPFSESYSGGGGIWCRDNFVGKISFFILAPKFSPQNSGHFLLPVHPQWRQSSPCLMALQQNWRCDEIFPA